MELKDSKTLKNLMKAYAGEMQAFGRYTQYSDVAYDEGYVQIGEIFAETAGNEYQHARLFFEHMNEAVKGEEVEITNSFPVLLGTTAENLKAAAAGENAEHSSMYPEFEKVAREEGFTEIAGAFREVGEVEEAHEARYLKLLENVENGKVFEKDEEVYWICLNCGYVHKGKKAPKECPACHYPQSYYKLFVEEY